MRELSAAPLAPPEVVGLYYQPAYVLDDPGQGKERAGASYPGMMVQLVRTTHTSTATELFEGYVYDAGTGRAVPEGRAPFSSTRKAAMRRWWDRETAGAPLPPVLAPSAGRTTKERNKQHVKPNNAGRPWREEDLISSYTRAQAIEDGVLIDVSPTAREAGFAVPVALTGTLYAEVEGATKGGLDDPAGRLRDLLTAARYAAQREPDESTVFFSVIMPVRREKSCEVKMVIGPGDEPGEPCLTLMRPDED